MQLIIHPGDELPIYRQIMRQITDALAGGRLKGGDKLPSHRELAEELVIAPLTVKKAYDELEALGFIETQRGRGTFVCAKLPKVRPAEQRKQIEASARKLVAQAYLAGLDFDEISEILKEAERELRQGQRNLASGSLANSGNRKEES
jgi:GntR family transcriptional regulator